MREIEVKILEIDRGAVEKRLQDLGAVRVFDGEMRAIYYDDPAGSLQADGKALRLRQEDTRAVLTFKAPVEHATAKVRDEIEVDVADFEAMRSLLAALGYSPWLEMQKHRVSYRLDGLHAEVDSYGGDFSFIPPFLEIEGDDLDTIHGLASRLGFSSDRCLPWDAVQLAGHYRTRRTSG